MPKRKLKPIGPKGSLGRLKTKAKTSSLSRPKSMTGKKFSSKLTSKGSIGGLGKAKTGRSVPKRKPWGTLPPPSGGRSGIGRPKPPVAGRGRKKSPVPKGQSRVT